MSMYMNVYVGPFLLVDRSKNFRVDDWWGIVADGRGEAGVGDPHYTLLPQQPLDISRPLSFDRYNTHPPLVIASNDIARELQVFESVVRPLIRWCSDNEVGCSLNWGVVQGWS